MRKTKWLAAGVIGLLAWNKLCAQSEHRGHGDKTGAQAVQGEVLDMACYMAHEGQGAKHKKCADKCIQGGAPLGLLTKEGQVYLLVEDHASPKPYAQIKGWAAEQVRVEGKVYERGGVRAIVVQSSAKAK